MRKVTRPKYCYSKHLLAAFWFAASWMLPLSAKGDFQLEFGQGGVLSNAFSIHSIGGTLEIEVYIRETSNTTFLSTEGLSFARFNLAYDDTIAKVQLNTDVTANIAFDGYATPDTSINPNSLDLSANAPIFTAQGVDRILLGTFKFTGISANTTTLTLTDGSIFDDFTTGVGTVLDSTLTGSSATLTITAVPEANSLIGAASIFSILFLRSRSLRRKNAADPTS